MASKNTVREFFSDYYYHVYTRGVNRRLLFKDNQDYNMFLRYLKLYLLPIDILNKITVEKMRINKFIRMNISHEVDLICFALMPNHIHLLIKLKHPAGIEHLTRRVLTAYAMYFNQKYKCAGHLFESRYKTVTVLTDEYLLYLTRYIHRNPIKSPHANKEFTSLPYFTDEKKANWIHPEMVLQYFSRSNPSQNYKSFVEDDAFEKELEGLKLEK